MAIEVKNAVLNMGLEIELQQMEFDGETLEIGGFIRVEQGGDIYTASVTIQGTAIYRISGPFLNPMVSKSAEVKHE